MNILKTAFFLLGVLAILSACTTTTTSSSGNKGNGTWSGLERGKIDLELPLLTIKGSKGFLACGYVSPQVCDKTGEACAIISGVMSHEEMLQKKIKAVSKKGQSLGLRVGMTGLEAISKIR